LHYLLLLRLSPGAAAQSKNASFQRGIELFQAADYSAALEEFKQTAQASSSNVPIQLWLGLSYTALDNESKAQDIWRAGIGDQKWEAAVWALKGLAYWKQNQKQSAVYYFKEAQPSQTGYQINRQLLERINNDEDMPPPGEWAQIVGLLKAEKSVNNQAPRKTAASPDDLTPPVEKNSGAKPRGGLWRGTITNQKGDQTITFRVSADGSMISDITFVGYWRCPNAMNPTQSTRNAPPDDVAVTGGAFSSTQNDKPSRLWYQFIGEFSSATQASGSIRIAYAGTECDTWKLQWTASRVGN
jgi:tetratricopeptide (TPR) repeat protein